MGWFSKKDEDVIDLTHLQNRGILKRSSEIAQNVIKNPSGERIIDLSGTNTSPTPQTSTTSTSSDNSSALGFLSDFASAATHTDSTQQSSYFAESAPGSMTENIRAARRAKFGEVNQLKLKLEDTEFKLEQTLQRLTKIEEKLAEFERRARY